jgi:organic radical activating enzyme
MNIYHISYTERFVGERMAMLSFKGCNFECIGCIMRRSECDIYAEERRYIDWSFEDIMRELEELNPHRIYLGGYEPTLDHDLIPINQSYLEARCPRGADDKWKQDRQELCEGVERSRGG